MLNSRRSRFLVLGAGLLLTAFYAYFIHRSTEIVHRDGWMLRFSYLPFHCRVCMGIVEELSHQGRPIRIPRWRWKTDNSTTPLAQVHTPVGDFRSFAASESWKLSPWNPNLEEVDQSISADELRRGWYDAASGDLRGFVNTDGPYVRKKGTPSHWCLLTTFDQARWVEPEKIDALEW